MNLYVIKILKKGGNLMKFEITQEHRSDDPTPITIRKGTRVKVGERSNSAGSWPNWIYCYSLDGEGEGWTPAQIIQIESEYGIILEDYSAKELGVKKGETVEGDIELNGWVWCSKVNGLEVGWVPKEKIIAIPVLK
jgi:hypothetical protein